MPTKTMSPILKATLDEALKLYLPPRHEWDEEDQQKWESYKISQECLIDCFRGRYLIHYISIN
jgi:hypothetical protein